jgi:hypothetical protein
MTYKNFGLNRYAVELWYIDLSKLCTRCDGACDKSMTDFWWALYIYGRSYRHREGTDFSSRNSVSIVRVLVF